MEKDILDLSAEEFRALEDYELEEALQTLAGHLAVAQAKMRANSEGYHAYLSGKETFTYVKSIASTLQTILRTKV